MVRINLISPKALADQHLIAEYNEILMLLGYVKKYPSLSDCKMPKTYCLGKGHILFFKNKLSYLRKRHELIKKEMLVRGFNPIKTISLKEFPKFLCKDFVSTKKDEQIIKARLIEK
jgi:deoxyribonuclease (pyrimidine dimer)